MPEITVEAEVKYKSDEKDCITIYNFFLSLGQTEIKKLIEEDIYFSHPCRNFGATDEALRIRKTTDENGIETGRITYKGRKLEGKSKSREEYEITINDILTFEIILKSLGFKEFGRVKKERTAFIIKVKDFIEAVSVDDKDLSNTSILTQDALLTITIDNVYKLGNFIEIEISPVIYNPETDQNTLVLIVEFLNKIGEFFKIDTKNCNIRKSYVELILESLS